ncbi:hypothetical protein Q4551_00005, partial [Oceanobacter sp. 5_MG-2023]|uniref:hypothetical protein n=1 Tax=Oceanobacter sp. 5_MG-2023 TaxID=3062645 RepID=UPI0026E42978
GLQVGFVIRNHPVAQSEHRIKWMSPTGRDDNRYSGKTGGCLLTTIEIQLAQRTLKKLVIQKYQSSLAIL